LPDQDEDFVVDADDACPNEPGAPSSIPDRNGCPGLVRVRSGEIEILKPVFFDTNKDTILPRSRPVLNAIAEALIATPEITLLSIEGHTDDVSDDDRNLDLSQRRANNVMRWLTAAGVDAARLRAEGFGESQPLVSETTREARAVNRRVEFRIVSPEAAP
jgi:outer membrane protein OmpA-like peptidoglycan-associated protein